MIKFIYYINYIDTSYINIVYCYFKLSQYLYQPLTFITKYSILDVAAVLDPPLKWGWAMQRSTNYFENTLRSIVARYTTAPSFNELLPLMHQRGLLGEKPKSRKLTLFGIYHKLKISLPRYSLFKMVLYKHLLTISLNTGFQSSFFFAAQNKISIFYESSHIPLNTLP